MFVDVLTLSSPVAVMLTPSASEASVCDVTMLIPAAPATVTVLPPELFLSEVVALALSVFVVFELVPVALVLCAFAFWICWVPLPFTSLFEPSPLPLSPLAPAALASASVVVVEVLVAEKVTAAPDSSRVSVA